MRKDCSVWVVALFWFQGAMACRWLSSLLAGASTWRRSPTINCARDAALLLIPAERRWALIPSYLPCELWDKVLSFTAKDIASSEVQPLVKSGANYQAPHTTSHRKTKWDRETRKQLLRISGVYTPLIVFWAIFYQQNSTWVLQGTQMDCYIGNLHIPPG